MHYTDKLGLRPHHLSGRAVASRYLGMVLVFMGFGRFQVSEAAIKQPQNVKLMREMQSTGQTDPI
ncbi:MAG: hypothetical protein S4CHLAM37_17060 [Chlamydiia bacterium]|nr:hypothetical protein [Chlamydiia bacterium]